MTQALINNLNNITKDCGLSQTDNSQKSEPIDFAKILDSKTDKIKFGNSVQNSENIQNVQNTGNSAVVISGLNNLREMTNEENPTISEEEFDNITEENLAETVIDLTISEDVFVNESTQTESNTEELTEDEIATDTNITEEEPTMNEDLTTLTNPTVAILIHSNQIFSGTKTIEKNDESNELIENNIPDNNSKSDSNNNAGIFKQFENNVSKEIPAQNLPEKANYDLKSDKSSLSKFLNKEVVKELNVEVVNQTSGEEQEESGDLMQNQTPQEQAAKVMIQGDIKYENVSKEVIKTSDVKPVEINPSKIIEQISRQLENLHNNSKLNMVLNPGNLGRVNIQIMSGKEGLTAQFTVTTQDARDLLIKGLEGLKESLLAQGINIDDVSIKLEESENEYQPDWTEQGGYRGGNKHQEARKNKDNEKTFEELIKDNESNSKDS